MTDYPEHIVNIAYFIVIAVSIGRFNPSVKDFFTSEFIMFCVFTLFMYMRNKNILLSMSISFFSTVGMSLLMTEDVMEKIKENFEFITGIDVKLGCENIKVVDLMKKFDGDENKLKEAMAQSQVPYNIELTDANAGLIATYLVSGATTGIDSSCSQFSRDATNEFKI